MRRFGKIDPEIKYTPRPGSYAVILGEDGLLVTHQAAPDHEFQLPGGGVDPGESYIQTLHREVLEETGWRIEPIRKLCIYQRFVYMPEYDLNAQKLCHIYLARAVRDLKTPLEDGHSVFWMSPDQAVAHLASEGDAMVVAELFGISLS